MIRLEAIHLGWLCLERPDDPAFQYRQLGRFKPPQGVSEPWRFILEGAMVRGAGGEARRRNVAGGDFVPLTDWQTSELPSWYGDPVEGMVAPNPYHLAEPPLKSCRILGKMLCWLGPLPTLSKYAKPEPTTGAPTKRKPRLEAK